jgi:hypothetical protein
MSQRKNMFQWMKATDSRGGYLCFDQDVNGLPVLRIVVDDGPSGVVLHRELFDLVTELCFQLIDAKGDSAEQLAQKLIDASTENNVGNVREHGAGVDAWGLPTPEHMRPRRWPSSDG